MDLGGVTTRSFGVVYLYLHSLFIDLANEVLCLGLQSLHQPHTVLTKHQDRGEFSNRKYNAQKAAENVQNVHMRVLNNIQAPAQTSILKQWRHGCCKHPTVSLMNCVC